MNSPLIDCSTGEVLDMQVLRRQAALRYIVRSLGRDHEPIVAVERLLSGDHDDTVRELLEQGKA